MKKILIDNRFSFLIISLWILFIFGILIFSSYISHFNIIDGYKLGNDSRLYLLEAKNVAAGLFPVHPNATSYLGFIYLLGFFEYFSIPLKYFVYFQIILSFFSSLCLFKITNKIFCKEAGYFALILFLFYFPLQIRNFYILTDLIFINFSIILFYFILFYNKINVLLAILFLIINLFIRPHGTIILPSIFLAVLIYFFLQKRFNLFYVFLVFYFIISIPLIYFVNMLIENEDVVDTLLKGEIIWGYNFDYNISFNNEYQYNKGIMGIIEFIFVNFYSFTKIFFLKIYWCLARIRPYYSDLHNLYINIFNIILYPSLIFSFFIHSKYNFGRISIIIYLVLFLMSIGFTFADWSGRFSLYIYPFIVILSSGGLSKIYFLFHKKFYS